MACPWLLLWVGEEEEKDEHVQHKYLRVEVPVMWLLPGTVVSRMGREGEEKDEVRKARGRASVNHIAPT